MLSAFRVFLVVLLVGVCLAVAAVSPPEAAAATYVVDSTADSPDAAPGSGGCDDGTGACTLRAAIQEANASLILTGSDTISFNIPGTGPHTIQPQSPLPVIIDAVTIDGYTEPGSSVNTAPISEGSNAVLMIELDGSNAGASADGLVLTRGTVLTPSSVRGLAINNFAGGSAIRTQNGAFMSITGNFIGTDVTGTTAAPNLTGVTSESGAFIGSNPAQMPVQNSHRNVISGNSGAGVSGTAISVDGNLIGVEADRLPSTLPHPLPNGGNGIELVSSTSGIAGSVGGFAWNAIAHNGGAGVADLSASASITISENSIHSNGGLGIEVTGPAPNPPNLTSAELDSGVLTIEGTHSGDPDTDYTLEFFSNEECDPSGSGEGRTFLGSVPVTTDGSGSASFNPTFVGVSSAERIYTATATEPGVATSEFSQCRALGADADADGVTTLAELNCGSDAFDSTLRPERIDGPFAGVDDDGDTQVDEGLPPGAEDHDCDGDGYVGSAEAHVYSYVPQTSGDQKVCQEYDLSHPNPNEHTKPSLRWPADLNKSPGPPNSFNRINILDLSSFVAPIRYLGKDVGTFPDDVRWDLSPGGGPIPVDINVLDLSTLVAGPTGYPAMFYEERAMNGPTCTGP